MIIFVESLPLSLLNLLAASLPSIIIVPVHLNSVYTGLCFRSLWLTSWFASIRNITLYIFISKFPENISFQHCVTNDLISMVWCIPTTTAIITTMTLIASSWGQHGAHLGPTGPRWAQCWPHETCYLGRTTTVKLQLQQHHIYDTDGDDDNDDDDADDDDTEELAILTTRFSNQNTGYSDEYIYTWRTKPIFDTCEQNMSRFEYPET